MAKHQKKNSTGPDTLWAPQSWDIWKSTGIEINVVIHMTLSAISSGVIMTRHQKWLLPLIIVPAWQYHQKSNLNTRGSLIRGVTIRVPQDTIRISIQRSRYNTYLNTVRCQRDVMSSMKAETPVIRSPAHNLLLQWMEYILLQLPMLSQDVTLLSYIRVFPSIWSEKSMCFN